MAVYTAVLNMNSFSLAKAEVLNLIGFVQVIKPEALAAYSKEVLADQLSPLWVNGENVRKKLRPQ